MKKEKQTRVKVDGLIECSLFFFNAPCRPPLSRLALAARSLNVEAWPRARGTGCCDSFHDVATGDGECARVRFFLSLDLPQPRRSS